MTAKTLKMGMHTVGEGQPVCIVFEAGPTHDGIVSAKKLVDMAVHAGANAIKFQMVNAKRLVPSKDTMFTYEALVDKATKKSERVTESLQEILLRRELKPQEWQELIRYCKEKDILFFSTATYEDEVILLHEAGCDCIKICSGDINHFSLLRLVARYPWIVQIDTGSATIGEVEQAVDVLESAGCDRIIINHCPSGYPAKLTDINLRVLATLRRMFPYPVAFSDHTPGNIMDVAAVALGAHMIEKTITLDKTTSSPEHIMSLEYDEAGSFVATIRDVETALGNSRRSLGEKERKNACVARRSIVAACDISNGTCIEATMLDYARPGDGLSPNLDTLIIGHETRRDFVKGEKIFPYDVK